MLAGESDPTPPSRVTRRTPKPKTLPKLIQGADAPSPRHGNSHNLHSTHNMRRSTSLKRTSRMSRSVHANPRNIRILEFTIGITFETGKRPSLNVLVGHGLEAFRHFFEIVNADFLGGLVPKARGECTFEPGDVWFGEGGVPAVEEIELDGVGVSLATFDYGVVCIADFGKGVHGPGVGIASEAWWGSVHGVLSTIEALTQGYWQDSR